jgi:hypothetical protein
MVVQVDVCSRYIYMMSTNQVTCEPMCGEPYMRWTCLDQNEKLSCIGTFLLKWLLYVCAKTTFYL